MVLSMIIKTLFSTVFFFGLVAWGIFVAVEKDPCTQVVKSAAPVRLVMQVARGIDSNLEIFANRTTWLLWSIKADALTQAGTARLLHGKDLVCPSF